MEAATKVPGYALRQLFEANKRSAPTGGLAIETCGRFYIFFDRWEAPTKANQRGKSFCVGKIIFPMLPSSHS